MEHEADLRIRSSLGRCPYCHDQVEPDERSACLSCLAVHHRDCWKEQGACAACGGTEVLLPVDADPTLLDLEAAAQRLRISPEEVEVLAFRGHLGAVQRGSQRVFRVEDVDALRGRLRDLLSSSIGGGRSEPRSLLASFILACALTACVFVVQEALQSAGLGSVVWLPLLLLLTLLLHSWGSGSG